MKEDSNERKNGMIDGVTKLNGEEKIERRDSFDWVEETERERE